MAKCQICRKEKATAIGACQNCFDDLKRTIKPDVETLKCLAAADLLNQSEDSKEKYTTECDAAYVRLRSIKDKHPAIMTVDIEKYHNEALEHLGNKPLPPNPADTVLTKKKQRFQLIVVIIAILVLLPIYRLLNLVARSVEDMLRVDGVVIAERAVKDNLKVPDSVNFDSSTTRMYTFDEVNVYGIGGEVSAENSFGVFIRHKYFVKFYYEGSGPHNAKIVEVKIVER